MWWVLSDKHLRELCHKLRHSRCHQPRFQYEEAIYVNLSRSPAMFEGFEAVWWRKGVEPNENRFIPFFGGVKHLRNIFV